MVKRKYALYSFRSWCFIFSYSYFAGYDPLKVFSKYSSSMEFEIEKKIELGYEPDLDTQYQIMYFCRKYD